MRPYELGIVKGNAASGGGKCVVFICRKGLLDEGGVEGGLGAAARPADGGGFANVKAGLYETGADGTCGGIGEELGVGTHDAFDLLKEVEGPTFAVAGGGEGVEEDEVDGGVGEKGNGVASIAPVHLNGLVGKGLCVAVLVEVLEGGGPVEGVVGMGWEGLGGVADDAAVHFEGGDAYGMGAVGGGIEGGEGVVSEAEADVEEVKGLLIKLFGQACGLNIFAVCFEAGAGAGMVVLFDGFVPEGGGAVLGCDGV